jgi:hypothetical protein
MFAEATCNAWKRTVNDAGDLHDANIKVRRNNENES